MPFSFSKYTIYAVIFVGCKFRCKLVKNKILICKKQHCLKETMFQLDDQQKNKPQNPSDLPSTKY